MTDQPKDTVRVRLIGGTHEMDVDRDEWEMLQRWRAEMFADTVAAIRRADTLRVFAGKPNPAADPLPVLMRLLKAGCVSVDGDMSHCCHYCRFGVDYESPTGATSDHAADCPYVEAITLFGDPNKPGSPAGVMKA